MKIWDETIYLRKWKWQPAWRVDFVGRIKFIKYWVEHKGVVGTWERVYVMSIENIISIYFLMKKNHIKLKIIEMENFNLRQWWHNAVRKTIFGL